MNRRFLIRRDGYWHFRMPVPVKYAYLTTRKELTISLKTTEFEPARAKANYLEYKVHKGLWRMVKKLSKTDIDLAIRDYLRKCLVLYDDLTGENFSYTAVTTARSIANHIESQGDLPSSKILSPYDYEDNLDDYKNDGAYITDVYDEDFQSSDNVTTVRLSL